MRQEEELIIKKLQRRIIERDIIIDELLKISESMSEKYPSEIGDLFADLKKAIKSYRKNESVKDRPA